VENIEHSIQEIEPQGIEAEPEFKEKNFKFWSGDQGVQFTAAPQEKNAEKNE